MQDRSPAALCRGTAEANLVSGNFLRIPDLCSHPANISVAALRYPPAKISEASKARRAAFDYASAHEYREATAALQPAVDAAPDGTTKGYVLQELASYLHLIDPAAAQMTQLKANRENRYVLRPLEGVTYERLVNPRRQQGLAASSWLQTRYESGTQLILGFNALVADLQLGPRTEAFEQAWSDLAWHIGLAGQRPERDIGRGPDSLWALPLAFVVFEIKSQEEDHPVYKRSAC